MQVYYNLEKSLEETAVALGFFDGVHTAHAEVIYGARQPGLVWSVLTFRISEGAPANKSGLELILPDAQRLERLESLGVERVYFPAFREMAGLSAEDFFRRILMDKLHARRLSCGYNYTFGQGAAGDTGLLRRLCAGQGIELNICPRLERDGELVSSSTIRELLGAGRIPEANALLGYRYYILGEVIHGRSLGRTLGFPTLNQVLSRPCVVPAHGVYNSVTWVRGKRYRSITNIGVKPTIEGERAPLAETYMLGAEGDFYGETARVELLEHTRPEQKFSSVEELREIVQRDISRR